MRKIQKIKCGICNTIFSTVGMAKHLSNTHSTNIEIYVKKYGEFRKKFIELNKLVKCIKCNICDEMVHTERALSFHLRIFHSMSRTEYSKKHIFKSGVPLCKCGCKSAVTLRNKYPYYREYISGHNPNPMTGKTHSLVSKTKMSDSAILRLNKLKTSGGKAPMHYRKYIFSRVYGDIQAYIINLNNRNISFMSPQIDIENDSKLLKFKCLSCNTEYNQNSLDITCRNCIKSSSLEQVELVNFIKNDLGIDIIENDRKMLNGFEIDIYIPSLKIGIEYNGIYWHSESSGNKSKKYHLDKTLGAETVGIKLISIFSDEWINKTEIVKNRLRYILNKHENKKIFARKCEIKEIGSNSKKIFLDMYHIQGSDKSQIKLGAFYKDELISVMTFSLPRIALGNKRHGNSIYEIVRFATNYNYNAVGMASKLLSYFIKKYKPTEITSYADRRWSTNISNNLYKSIGFNFIKNTQPNYWYTYKYKERLHRFNFTKHKLIKLGGDPSKSEWQIMQSMGYDRIWDCGNLKYEMIVK